MCLRGTIAWLWKTNDFLGFQEDTLRENWDPGIKKQETTGNPKGKGETGTPAQFPGKYTPPRKIPRRSAPTIPLKHFTGRACLLAHPLVMNKKRAPIKHRTTPADSRKGTGAKEKTGQPGCRVPDKTETNGSVSSRPCKGVPMIPRPNRCDTNETCCNNH